MKAGILKFKDFKELGLIAGVLLLGYFFTSLRPEGGFLPLEAGVFALAIYALVKAADNFTKSAVHIGQKLGMGKLETGVLIIAIGTSAPEFFSSIAAAIENRPHMVIGNVLGTVIANTLLGIGCAALFAKKPLEVHNDVFGTQMSVLFAAILLALGALYDGKLYDYEAIILLSMLIVYLWGVLKGNQAVPVDISEFEEDAAEAEKPTTLEFVLLVGNLFGLFFAGDLVVSSLIESATILDLAEAKLATSILAIGTSIPEIATAIALVRQGNPDSLFGEIIGSNIIDILGIFGAIGLFQTLTMEPDLLLFLSISMLVTFVMMKAIMNDKRINRVEGYAIVAIFVVFTGQLASL